MALVNSKIKYIFYQNNKDPYTGSLNATCRDVIFTQVIEDVTDAGYITSVRTPTPFNPHTDHMSLLLKQEYHYFFDKLTYSRDWNDALRPEYRPDADMDEDTQLYFGLYKHAALTKKHFFSTVIVPHLYDMMHNTVKINYRKLRKFTRTRVASVSPADLLIHGEPTFTAIVFRSNGLVALECALTYIILWRLYDPDYFMPEEINIKEHKTKFPQVYKDVLSDRINFVLSTIPKTPLDLVHYFARNPEIYLYFNTSHLREDIYMLLFYMLTRKYTFPVVGDFIANHLLKYGASNTIGLLRTYIDTVEDAFNTKLWWIRSDTYVPENRTDPTKHIENIYRAAEDINLTAEKYAKITS